MITHLLTARHIYRQVATPADLARRQEECFARRLMQTGVRTVAHEEPSALVARVNHGRWIADCRCGGACGVDPEWPEARCFGCGAVYRRVQFPPAAERRRIEGALLRRKAPQHRNWRPGDTVAGLAADNVAHPHEVI